MFRWLLNNGGMIIRDPHHYKIHTINGAGPSPSDVVTVRCKPPPLKVQRNIPHICGLQKMHGAPQAVLGNTDNTIDNIGNIA